MTLLTYILGTSLIVFTMCFIGIVSAKKGHELDIGTLLLGSFLLSVPIEAITIGAWVLWH